MVEALVGAVVSAVIGAVLGGLTIWWIEREKAKTERERQRAKTAYEACQRMHELLGDWYSAIRRATKFEVSPEKTMDNLVAFMGEVHFDSRIGNQVELLRSEPLCNDLIERTNSFSKSAYKQKTAVAGGEIRNPFVTKFAGRREDYETRREEALLYLRGQLKAFEDELNRITPLLQDKAQ